MKWQEILNKWIREEKPLYMKYDGKADILYISIDKPVPSYCDEEDGYLLRYSLETGELSGMTVIDFGFNVSGFESIYYGFDKCVWCDRELHITYLTPSGKYIPERQPQIPFCPVCGKRKKNERS